MESLYPLRPASTLSSASSFCGELTAFLLLLSSLPRPSHGDPKRWSLCAGRRQDGAPSEQRSTKKDQKRRLSHILRTEAAILAVERKSNSPKSRRLWPKAVLEALHDAIASDRWESALKIFELLRRQHWYNPICRTYARLLMMLGRCGQPEHATIIFQTLISEGLTPTVDVYTSLIGAYGFNGHLDKAFQTVEEMKSVSDCRPDVYTYTMLINCCCKQGRYDLISRALTDMAYLGIECSIVTYNTLIDGFGKAGLLDEMENYMATMLEDSNCLPDVYTMNSILWAYGNAGKIDKMEESYNEFQLMKIEPDEKTFNILIRSYGKAGMDEKISRVMNYMERRFFPATTVTYNIVIECFGKARDIKKMERFFQLMKFQGIKPNSITYCSLINAYSVVGMIEMIPSILRQIENSDAKLDTPFFNCLLNAYGKVGDVETMEDMFFLMKKSKCKPDLITYSTMILAYNCLGMIEAAHRLEDEMAGLKKHSLPSPID